MKKDTMALINQHFFELILYNDKYYVWTDRGKTNYIIVTCLILRVMKLKLDVKS